MNRSSTFTEWALLHKKGGGFFGPKPAQPYTYATRKEARLEKDEEGLDNFKVVRVVVNYSFVA